MWPTRAAPLALALLLLPLLLVASPAASAAAQRSPPGSAHTDGNAPSAAANAPSASAAAAAARAVPAAKGAGEGRVSIDDPSPARGDDGTAAASAKAADAAVESAQGDARALAAGGDASRAPGAHESVVRGGTGSASAAVERDTPAKSNASGAATQPNKLPEVKVTKSHRVNTHTSPASLQGVNNADGAVGERRREEEIRESASAEAAPRIVSHGSSESSPAGNGIGASSEVNAKPAGVAAAQDDNDYTDPLVAAAEADDDDATTATAGTGGVGGAGGEGGSLLEAAGARLQRLLGAAQEAAEALAEVPRQLWLLPIRLGFYPGLTRQQEAIPRLAPFPCAAGARQARSAAAPASVHRLRPGDVRVVAALGDSLTAANGALAYSEEETRLNYRGVSAYGGGQGTWREYLTLPNILKEFNPKLLGYALGVAEAGEARAGLNLARNGALDDELPAQARRLVRALHQHPYVDVERDWKLVNLLVGGNDLCNEYCYSDDGRHSPEGHARALRATLDYLQRHLPRTLVNLVHIPNILQLRNMRNVPFACHLKQLVLCSCLFGGAERAKAESVGRMLRGYWSAERDIAADPRYDSDNFTVVLQPFFLGVDFPDAVSTWFGEAPDLSYFAPDCFHFSQKGNALAANALWNNMLEPEGHKSLGWRPLLQRFLCPNASAPYFFTRRNSQTFLEKGSQD